MGMVGSSGNPNDSSRIREAQQKAFNEGLPSIIVLDNPLPGGAVAIGKFAPGESIDSYIALTADHFTSGLLNQVLANAFGRRTAVHLGVKAREAETVTWFADGRFVTQRASGESRESRSGPIRERPDDRMSHELARRLRDAPRVTLPDLGQGRVVELDKWE